MHTHNVCFHGDLRKIACGFPFYLELWCEIALLGHGLLRAAGHTNAQLQRMH